MVEITWAPFLVNRAEDIAREYPEIVHDVQALRDELESGQVSADRIPPHDSDSVLKWPRESGSESNVTRKDFQLIVIQWKPNVYYIVDVCEGDDCDDYPSGKILRHFRSLRMQSLRPSS